MAGQPDEVRQTVIDLGLSADQWIRALEFKPGDVNGKEGHPFLHLQGYYLLP